MSAQSRFNWKILSDYRTQLFGLAIISIIVFHYFEDVLEVYQTGLLHTVLRLVNYGLGNIGVEIFLFLSGIGLYFSMSRNSHIGQFYSKRFQRVLVPYLIWGMLYWPWKDFMLSHTSVGMFFLDYTTISLWTRGNRAAWYVNFILVMYLVFPLLFWLFRKAGRHRGILTVVLIGVSYGLTIATKFLFPTVYQHIEIELYRIPIFLLGIYYGKACAEGKKISCLDVFLLIFGLLFKLAYALGRYGVIPYIGKIPERIPAAFYCFAVLFLFLVIVKAFGRVKFLNAALLFCGTHSFELYITHVHIRSIMRSYGIATHQAHYYLICVLLSLVCSFLLKKVADWLLKLPQKRRAQSS